MDFRSMAVRVASINIEARKKAKKTKKPAKKQRRVSQPHPKPRSKPQSKNVLTPATEYSCQVELSLTADFEGNVSKSNLLKKLQTELVAAIQTGVKMVARDFAIQATGITVRPLNINCAVTDQMSIEDNDEDLN